MKSWHFQDKTFRRWLVVFEGTIEEFREEMEAQGYKHMEFLQDANGMCIYLNPDNCFEPTSNAHIIWLRKYHTPTLVHEITHFVMDVFEHLGIPISHENTETFAHYTEYWFTEIQRVRRKYPDGREPKDAK